MSLEIFNIHLSQHERKMINWKKLNEILNYFGDLFKIKKNKK